MAFSSRNLLSLARTALRVARHLAPGPAKAPGPNQSSGDTPGRRQPSGGTPGNRQWSGNAGRRQPSGDPARPGSGQSSTASSQPSPPRSPRGSEYAGDYRGPVTPVYAPKPDGDPDPGEVVWAWVPYEDDPSQGKDRPVLLIGWKGSNLLGLMLTTRDRNNSRGSDPDYLDIGTGAWDSKGRPSEVKLDRIVQLDPADIRRQGAVVERSVFERVAKHLSELRG